MDNQYIAVGLSSPLSKSSFILFILGVFHTPKSSLGRNRESGSLSVYLLYTSGTRRMVDASRRGLRDGNAGRVSVDG